MTDSDLLAADEVAKLLRVGLLRGDTAALNARSTPGLADKSPGIAIALMLHTSAARGLARARVRAIQWITFVAAAPYYNT
jgi:hypothetical protein